MKQELEHLLELVCQQYGISLLQIKSGSRHRTKSFPRHVFHYLSYNYELGSLNEIGAITGRNHATVYHSYKQVRDWLNYDKKLQEDINALNHRYLNSSEVQVFKEKLKTIPLEMLPKFIEHIEKFQCKSA